MVLPKTTALLKVDTPVTFVPSALITSPLPPEKSAPPLKSAAPVKVDKPDTNRLLLNVASVVKPGLAFKEVYLESARVIVRGLKDMGLMKGNVDDAVANGAHALFFPCGLGHMMGMDVHDMEDLGETWVGWDGQKRPTQFGIKSLRLGRKLVPGFVLTIEPGIYFIPELIE